MQPSVKRLCLLLPLLVGTGSASALDLKGLSIGDSWDPATIERAFNDTTASSVRCISGTSICAGLSNLAGTFVSFQIFRNDAKIFMITGEFDPTYFDDLTEKVRAKFGEPTVVTTATVTNRLGISFPDPMMIWRDGPVSLTVEKASKPTQAAITLSRTPPKQPEGKL